MSVFCIVDYDDHVIMEYVGHAEEHVEKKLLENGIFDFAFAQELEGGDQFFAGQVIQAVIGFPVGDLGLQGFFLCSFFSCSEYADPAW